MVSRLNLSWFYNITKLYKPSVAMLKFEPFWQILHIVGPNHILKKILELFNITKLKTDQKTKHIYLNLQNQKMSKG